MPDSECCICMDAQVGGVFIPCAHACCCIRCGPKTRNKCPLCRTVSSFQSFEPLVPLQRPVKRKRKSIAINFNVSSLKFPLNLFWECVPPQTDLVVAWHNPQNRLVLAGFEYGAANPNQWHPRANVKSQMDDNDFHSFRGLFVVTASHIASGLQTVLTRDQSIPRNTLLMTKSVPDARNRHVYHFCVVN